MTNSIYSSKKEFHAFSRAASNAFNSKLTTTQFKLAKEDGYKNTNSLLSALPDASTVSSEYVAAEESELCYDDLSEYFWQSYGSFIITGSDGRFQKRPVKVNAPAFVSLIKDNKIFCDQNILLMPINIQDVDESDSYTVITLSLSTNNSSSEKMMSYPFAVLQSNLNTNYVITCQDVLKLQFHNKGNIRTLASYLIELGSVKQFNAICRMPDLVEELNLIEELNDRYFKQILNLGYESGSFEEFVTGMPYIAPATVTKEDKDSILTDLATPLEALNGDANRLFVQVHPLFEYLESELMDKTEEDLLSDSNPSGENYLSILLMNLRKKMNEKDYELSNLDNSLKVHFLNFFKMYSRHIELESIHAKEDIEDFKYSVLYFFWRLQEFNVVLDEFKFSENLLLTKTCIPQEPTILDVFVNNTLESFEDSISNNNEDMDFVLSCTQALFKFIPDSLMTRKVKIVTNLLRAEGELTTQEALGQVMKLGRMVV
ncbi:hypothetical protein [Vibrio sp. D431a]|uniref:hypothetical protein n=1 Tax=Vibrio sp. D431a TaxID=2837388 RepID=UPI0025534C23|nr:hypothetical protein [Vibrio sp. D431a]MDK9789950.1 hypothetical protein [Vibrio sp. D431a]